MRAWLLFTIISILGNPLVAQIRMIPHVTRADGGFTSRVILENLDVAPSEYRLLPYATGGEALPPVSGVLDNMETAIFSVASLFPDRDDLSHFVIEGDSVRATIAYRAVAGGSPAHAPETREQAARFRIFSGDWQRVFDGVAVVNTGTETTDVWVAQHPGGGGTGKTVKAFSLDPWAKGLYVIGGPGLGEFTPDLDSWFEIYASQPLALTSLRGSLPGSEFLWVNQASVYRPAVVKVINDRPIPGDCVDPTSLAQDTADLNNMPQGEVWIDVAPDGRLAACAKDYRYSPIDNTTYNDRVWNGLYLSGNDGNSWQNTMFTDSNPNQGLTAATSFGRVNNEAVFLGHQSDPVVAFDRDGNLFTCALAFQSDHIPGTSIFLEPSTVLVSKRDPDGNLIPGTTHFLAMEADPTLFNDKNWIAVDRTSPADATPVVVTWRLFNTGDDEASRPQGGYICVSADGGASFGEPIQLPIPTEEVAATQFYQPIFGPDPTTGRKTLYIFFRRVFRENFSYHLQLIKADIDGLQPGTASLHEHLSDPESWTYLPGRLGGLFYYGTGGYDGAFRFNSYFMPTVDLGTGHLYAVAHAFDLDSEGTSVRAVRSTDGGTTWTPPVKIDYPGHGYQLMPAAAFHGETLSVVWYDSRNDSAFAPFTNIREIDVYYAELDRDLNTTRVVRITPESQKADHPAFTRVIPMVPSQKKAFAPHDVNPALLMDLALFPLSGRTPNKDVSDCDGYGFIGDYIGIAADRDNAYLVWADLRDLETSQDICTGSDCNGRRNQNVYFARVRKDVAATSVDP